jgi:hypothetical protein
LPGARFTGFRAQDFPGAEEWEQCALDEVAFHFGERNLVVPITKQAPTTSTRANEALSLR